MIAFELGFPQLWGPHVCSGVPGAHHPLHPGWCALMSLISIVTAEERNRTPSSRETYGQSPPNLKPRTPPRLVPKLLGSHRPNVHRLHEGKAQRGLLNLKLIQHTANISLIFILRPVRWRSGKRSWPPSLTTWWREPTPTSCLLTSTCTLWCMCACT